MAATEGADAFFDRIFGDDLFNVLRCTLSMASSATCDLPEPVGKTTITRWSCCSQASMLSLWCGWRSGGVCWGIECLQ